MKSWVVWELLVGAVREVPGCIIGEQLWLPRVLSNLAQFGDSGSNDNHQKAAALAVYQAGLGTSQRLLNWKTLLSFSIQFKKERATIF